MKGKPICGAPSFAVEATITLLGSSVDVFGTFREHSNSAAISAAIDCSRELELVFMGRSPEEQYQINSLAVIATVVPEPGAFTLAGAFLVVLVVVFGRVKMR